MIIKTYFIAIIKTNLIAMIKTNLIAIIKTNLILTWTLDCMLAVVGSQENCKTAQYMMQIKIKEKMQKGNAQRYVR